MKKKNKKRLTISDLKKVKGGRQNAGWEWSNSTEESTKKSSEGLKQDNSVRSTRSK